MDAEMDQLKKRLEKEKTEFDQTKRDLEQKTKDMENSKRKLEKTNQEILKKAEEKLKEIEEDLKTNQKELDVLKRSYLQQRVQGLKEIEDKKTQLEEERKKYKGMIEDKWDSYYMRLACLAALRSKDPSTPVGAVIVDTELQQIVGIGYNSMPYIEGRNNDIAFPWKGGTGANEDDESTKRPFVVHSAVNAIANKTKESVKGCTIYLTLPPDPDCAHAIIRAGISTVKYGMKGEEYFKRKRQGEAKEKLQRSFLIGQDLLTKKDIKIEELKLEEGLDENDAVKRLNTRIKKAEERHKNDRSPEHAADDYIKWDKFFMDIAILSKTRPGVYDMNPSKAQGACIVTENKQVVSIGFSEIPVEPEQDENTREYSAHAEYKAILEGPPVRGCTLYVTLYPCNVCAKLIVQSGIAKVFYNEDGGNGPRYKNSKTILTKCLGEQNIRKF